MVGYFDLPDFSGGVVEQARGEADERVDVREVGREPHGDADGADVAAEARPHLAAELLEGERVCPVEERAHDLRAKPVSDLARAGVAEAAGAEGDAAVVGEFLDAAVVDGAAVAVVEGHGHGAAARFEAARAVDLDERLPGVVVERGEAVDQPARQRHDAVVDGVDADGGEVAQADLDRGDVEVVDRAVLEPCFAGDEVVPVALDGGNGDGAARVPGAPEPVERLATGEERAHAGGVAEHLVEGEGHEVGATSQPCAWATSISSSGCWTPEKFDCAG
ncbi:MAG: hypothetical protein MUC34_20855 [Anaerolineae bacterium]|nr:hypothetical protein [Anaerolineae bacterium]